MGLLARDVVVNKLVHAIQRLSVSNFGSLEYRRHFVMFVLFDLSVTKFIKNIEVQNIIMLTI